MKKYSFKKMSGAGNDFVLFDKSENAELVLDANNIQNICDRRNGVGADGVIIIGYSTDKDFEMKYFNADGSLGSLCGNGARCALRYYFNNLDPKAGRAEFSCGNKFYKGENLNNESTKFYFDEPEDLKINFTLKAGNQLINSSYVNTGSPHAVIKISDVLQNPSNPHSYYKSIKDFPVKELGKEIRYLTEFKGGTNVNFIDFENNKVLIRTFERGVEDETLACGTGSVAAAIICSANYNMDPPFNLITWGGNELIVNFEKKENSFFNISLTGPAKIVYTGEISI
jgi:diaminopimelate epimerase